MVLTREVVQQFYDEHPAIAEFAQFTASRNLPESDKRKELFNRLLRAWVHGWASRNDRIQEVRDSNSWAEASSLGADDFPQWQNPFDMECETVLYNGYEYGFEIKCVALRTP